MRLIVIGPGKRSIAKGTPGLIGVVSKKRDYESLVGRTLSKIYWRENIEWVADGFKKTAMAVFQVCLLLFVDN
ncbi:hypothetical protein MIB92_00220 [Aestuariirhabdus sp. Z084]|uniref:hypothetical protein n=1 Tax=Aestuariirhabdus haliotis TaxID=2918751 RepID=UPI00201B3D52|nr:hypothetical protein [Aestuariirhabdus haliotis]MCL6414060.1 hypothetical protein [Aestuariirhabdus haliotis]MCL6417993.1 hypothetical protein [Aestuariirhabdus haliotis]